MSNRSTKLGTLAAIPQISGGTVADADKLVVGPSLPAGAGTSLLIQTDPFLIERTKSALIFKVTDAGSHVSFVSTVEGSQDGTLWFGLQWTTIARTGLTVDENGIGFALAVATPGLVLSVAGGFAFYRVGIAGDNAAADGAAVVGIHAVKEV